MSANNLIDVETFDDFDDLPEFYFNGSENPIMSNEEIQLDYLIASHYVVYRIIYKNMPPSHLHNRSYLIYDSKELKEHRRKVYKIFDSKMDEIGLGPGTYDIGLLFSEGRVYADSHFIKMKY